MFICQLIKLQTYVHLPMLGKERQINHWCLLYECSTIFYITNHGRDDYKFHLHVLFCGAKSQIKVFRTKTNNNVTLDGSVLFIGYKFHKVMCPISTSSLL